MSTEIPENNLQLSSAQDFKKKASERKKPRLLKLPSGLVVELINPDYISLVQSGFFPADLIEMAIKGEEKVKLEKTKEAKKEIKSEDVVKSSMFMKKLVIASVNRPKIVEENPTDEEILYADLAGEDIIAIMNVVEEAGKTQENFRKPEQADSSPAGQDLPEVSGNKTK